MMSLKDINPRPGLSAILRSDKAIKYCSNCGDESRCESSQDPCAFQLTIWRCCDCKNEIKTTDD